MRRKRARNRNHNRESTDEQLNGLLTDLLAKEVGKNEFGKEFLDKSEYINKGDEQKMSTGQNTTGNHDHAAKQKALVHFEFTYNNQGDQKQLDEQNLNQLLPETSSNSEQPTNNSDKNESKNQKSVNEELLMWFSGQDF